MNILSANLRLTPPRVLSFPCQRTTPHLILTPRSIGGQGQAFSSPSMKAKPFAGLGDNKSFTPPPRVLSFPCQRSPPHNTLTPRSNGGEGQAFSRPFMKAKSFAGHGDNKSSADDDVHGDNKSSAADDVHGDNKSSADDDVHGDNKSSAADDVHGDNKSSAADDVHGDNKSSAADDIRGRFSDDLERVLSIYYRRGEAYCS